jgi:hypothetical protein
LYTSCKIGGHKNFQLRTDFNKDELKESN